MTRDLSGDPRIDGLLTDASENGITLDHPVLAWGNSNTLGAGVTLDYSFMDAPHSASMDNFEAMNANLQTAVTSILDYLETVTQLSFNFTTAAGDADLNFGTAALPVTANGFVSGVAYTGFAYYPGDYAFYTVAEVYLTNAVAGYSDAPVGTNAYATLIHEIGHALGLDHSFSGLPVPDGTDNTQYTVMSYTDYYTNDHPTSMMMYDLLALHYLYGANTNHNTGDDVINLDSITSDGAYVLWDAGGHDTLQLSNAGVLRLGEGTFSDVGGVQNLFGVAFGATIENGVGSAGDDFIYGSVIDNTLSGEDGNDSLFGGEGNDTISGGNGEDALYGDAGDDLLIAGIGRDDLYGGEGLDRLRGNSGNDDMYGGVGADRMDGASGADTMQGGAGNDIVEGEGGNDRLNGDDNDDIVRGGGGFDRVSGDGGNDRVEGNSGNDTVNGNGGNDTVTGGGGNDSVYGDNGDDIVNGNSGNDTLFGGSGSDILSGGANDDLLDGGEDNDIMIGGNGADFINGGSGNDTMTGGNDADTFQFFTTDGIDVITDFEDNIDLLVLYDGLWAGTLTAQQVVDTYASDVADGVQFNFVGGESLQVTGVSTLTIVNDIDFIFA